MSWSQDRKKITLRHKVWELVSLGSWKHILQLTLRTVFFSHIDKAVFWGSGRWISLLSVCVTPIAPFTSMKFKIIMWKNYNVEKGFKTVRTFSCNQQRIICLLNFVSLSTWHLLVICCTAPGMKVNIFEFCDVFLLSLKPTHMWIKGF